MPWNLVLPTSNLTPLSRERWRPRLRSGFMNIGDRRLFLYGKKRTLTLESATCSRFVLSKWPYPYASFSTAVSGVDYRYFVLVGNEVVVAHIDLGVFVPFWGSSEYDESEWVRLRLTSIDFSEDSSVVFSYYYLNDSGVLVSQTDTFRFGDSTKEYWIPDYPSLGSPIVVTDDVPTLQQYNKHVQSFRLDTSSELVNIDDVNAAEILRLRSRLVFSGPDNYIRNPCFRDLDRLLGVRVANNWKITGTGVGFSETTEPFHGTSSCFLYGGDWVFQDLSIGNLEQVTVNAFVKSIENDTQAVLGIGFTDATGVNFIDLDGTPISPASDKDFLYAYDESFVNKDSWTRLSLHIGQPDAAHPVVATGLPDVDSRLLVKVGGTGVIVGAVQVAPGFDVQEFTYLDPKEVTVEYDVSDDGVYSPNQKLGFPYDIDDVDLNPTNSIACNGFLSWVDSEFASDYQLGFGRPVVFEDSRGWIQYLGTGSPDVTALLQDFDNTGSFLICTPTGTNYGLSPSNSLLIAYIDGSTSGLLSPAQADDHRDNLISGIQATLDSGLGFAGVLIDIGDSARLGLPNEWVRILSEIEDHIHTGYPGQSLFGLQNGLDLFDESVANRQVLARDLDIVVAEGITRPRYRLQNTEEERRYQAFRLRKVQEECIRSGNRSAVFLTLDYVSDDRDVELATDARHFSRIHGWIPGIARDDGVIVDIEASVFSPYGFPSAVGAGTGGVYLGRQHVPYAELDGPGKLVYRASFPDNLLEQNDYPSFATESNSPAKISFLPTTSVFRDGGTGVAVVPGKPNVVSHEYFHEVGISVLVSDEVGNPCEGVPVHITCDRGSVRSRLIDPGSKAVGYTDHGGYVYLTYSIPDSFSSDVIRAAVRRFGVTGTMRVEVI